MRRYPAHFDALRAEEASTLLPVLATPLASSPRLLRRPRGTARARLGPGRADARGKGRSEADLLAQAFANVPSQILIEPTRARRGGRGPLPAAPLGEEGDSPFLLGVTAEPPWSNVLETQGDPAATRSSDDLHRQAVGDQGFGVRVVDTDEVAELGPAKERVIPQLGPARQ
jgi:hypothetical protein